LLNNTTGSYNLAIGDSALFSSGTGSSNIGIGSFTGTSASNLTNAAAIGTRAFVAQSNSMVLGSINGTNGATATTSVGIGITAPTKRLHVRGNGASGAVTNGGTVILMEDNADSYFEMSTPNANENGILSSIPVLGIRSGIIFRADSSIQVRSGGNTTSMTIDKVGNVGIGIIAPTQKLHVLAPTTVRNAGYFVSSNTTNILSNGSAILAENNAIGSNDVAAVIGNTLFTDRGYGLGGYFQGGYIGSYNRVTNINPGASNFSTYGTYSENTVTNPTNANYGIYTFAQNSATSNYGLYAQGAFGSLINYGVFGTASGGTTANYGVYGSVAGTAANTSTRYAVYGTAGSGTNYWAGYFNGYLYSSQVLQISDEHLKTAFKPTEGILAKLMNIKVSEYEYDQNLSKQNNMAVPQGRQIGFTAQNLALQFPELVKDVNHPINEEKEPDGNGGPSKEGVSKSSTGGVVNKGFYQFKGVNYSGMVPVLTKAVQEQQQIINTQQNQIDDLLKRVSKLEQK